MTYAERKQFEALKQLVDAKEEKIEALNLLVYEQKKYINELKDLLGVKHED